MNIGPETFEDCGGEEAAANFRAAHPHPIHHRVVQSHVELSADEADRISDQELSADYRVLDGTSSKIDSAS